MGESAKGKIVSEETRRKMSETNKGKNNPMYGKTHSDDAKRKMSEVLNGKKRAPFSEERRRKLSEAGNGRTFSEEHRRR